MHNNHTPFNEYWKDLDNDLRDMFMNREGLLYSMMKYQMGWIDQQGSVTRVQVEESSGYSLLDAAAVTSVRTWRVQPAQRGGQPVAGSWLLPIRFRQP